MALTIVFVVGVWGNIALNHMAAETRFVSTTRWFINLLSASAICMSIFGRHPPVGFAMKFSAFAFLIAARVMFWRAVAHKFHWPGIIRGLIPSVLFLAPIATLHAFDRSFGSQKGDWAGGVLILAVISVVSVKLETLVAGTDEAGAGISRSEAS